MPVETTVPARASLVEPRYGRIITVEIIFDSRAYRHVQVFARNKADRARARKLVSRINERGGLTLAHVHRSEHWIRTGQMSGCVQVNQVTVSDVEIYTSVSGRQAVRYTLSGPVAPHWGQQPKPGAVWNFGTQHDYTGRTPEQIKTEVEAGWTPSIFGCESREFWPYLDTDLEAALNTKGIKEAA